MIDKTTLVAAARALDQRADTEGLKAVLTALGVDHEAILWTASQREAVQLSTNYSRPAA